LLTVAAAIRFEVFKSLPSFFSLFFMSSYWRFSFFVAYGSAFFPLGIPESKNVISSYCLGGLHWVMITEITISDKKYPVTVFYDGDMAQHSPNMLWRKLNPNFSLNGDVIIISDVILPFPSKKREENKKLILKQIHDLSQMLLVNEF